MISAEKALELARQYLAQNNRRPHGLSLVTDTTNFFQVDYNKVILLDSKAYLIQGDEREGRFGMDDQVKHWVKKAVDLTDGQRKVIKLAFFEHFELKMGSLSYECFRSPKKEARILDLVRGRPEFMQGFSRQDAKGNNVRVLDFVYGTNLHQLISNSVPDHEEYFHHTLPGLLDAFRPALTGLGYLHQHGEKHGDVRRDHLIHSKSGCLVWIDFDYNYRHGENPAGLDLAGLGNILIFLVGGGDHTLQKLQREDPKILSRLTEDDLSLAFSNRVANLKKLFPYIPEELNNILKHFSNGANVFYDSVAELVADLDEARTRMP